MSDRAVSNVKLAALAACFIGFMAVLFYPAASNAWNTRLQQKLIAGYEKQQELEDPAKSESLWQDAAAFNRYRGNEEKLKSLGLSYETVLNQAGDGMMGYIEIPRISVELPVYHSLKESVLQEGLGHMETTPLPVGGKGNRSVLAGHTGLASAKLLSNLDRVRTGDFFRIHVAGHTLIYQVMETAVVLPTQVEYLAAVEGEDLVTLVTCTPYGVNSHRLLVTGRRVDEEALKTGSYERYSELEILDPRQLLPYELGMIVLTAALTMLVLWTVKKIRRKEDRPCRDKN